MLFVEKPLASFGSVANKIVGSIGGPYSSLPTTTFWLIHVASAGVGLVAFLLFRAFMSRRLAPPPQTVLA